MNELNSYLEIPTYFPFPQRIIGKIIRDNIGGRDPDEQQDPVIDPASNQDPTIPIPEEKDPVIHQVPNPKEPPLTEVEKLDPSKNPMTMLSGVSSDNLWI